MNLYIVITIVFTVYAVYYFTHRLERINIKQIIFTTLDSDHCMTLPKLHEVFPKYDIRISPLRLRITLWYLTLLGRVQHRSQGWKLPQPRSVPVKLGAS